MSYYWSGEGPETSHQITLDMIHQDLQGYMDKTDEKLGMLQEQISQILREMSGVLRTQEQEIEVFSDDSEPEFNEEEERQYNEMILQVQQQILAHREKTNAKLKVKEELTADYEGAPVFDEEPQEEECDAGEQQLILALGLQTQHSEGPPIYDEYPEEDKREWKEEGLILAALGEKEVNRQLPLQFKGVCNGTKINILVDGGSTHSCLDEVAALSLKSDLVGTVPRQVLIVNGNHLEQECIAFSWKTRGQGFQTSVKTPTLGSYDMEMGVCQRKEQGFMYVLFATKAEVAKLEDLSKEQEGSKVPRLKVTIYIFDPGGKKLEDARATMRVWLIFKEGGMSGMALLAL